MRVSIVNMLTVPPQTELNERHSMVSESGSSTDSHVENLETKDGEPSSFSLSYSMQGFIVLIKC